MADIVDLQAYRTRIAAERAYGIWHQRLGETYPTTAKPADLSDKTLLLLATPGETGTMVFYDFIMAALDLGKGPEFGLLSKTEQMQVMEIHLFMADQIRFELMIRLKWLQTIPTTEWPPTLIDMVLRSEAVKFDSKYYPPRLVPTHPDYGAFQTLIQREKEVFVRKMLRDALDEFGKWMKNR